MNKLNFSTKSNGDVLNATEWNSLVSKTDELVEAINNGGSGSGTPTVIDSNGIMSVSSKGNVTVGSSKNVNVEPAWDNNVSGYSGNYGDIALKPGDDIQLCSHHREPKKRDKIVVKAIDGSDNPVKMQVVSGEIDLAVGTANNPKTATKKKDKTTGADTVDAMFKPGDAKVLDLRVLTGNVLDEGSDSERDERGYLKVRAQAIDLRCEKHGGIALQPKGYDSDGNMNKIKFEHGGGDGLEFATFNTEKTSIFTDEYRFNRDGIWKMATRTTEPSGKDIIDERDNGLRGLPATGAYKYVKQADDFYDIISQDDEQCRTKDIIKTAYAMNGYPTVHTKITNKGALEIATETKWQVTELSVSPNDSSNASNAVVGKYYDVNEITELFGDVALNVSLINLEDGQEYSYTSTEGTTVKFVKYAAKDIKIDSAAGLKLGGILDFGSSFNFGETDNGIEVQYKLTKKNSTKDCGILKVVGVNNHESNTLTVEGVTINPGETDVIAQCSILDIIKLVNYMKTNNQGPWAV